MKAYELAKIGMLIESEIDLLEGCLKCIPPQSVIINIGAGVGTSTAVMVEVCPDSFVFSVDMYPKEEEFENLEQLGLSTRNVTRILGRSDKVGWGWPFEIDLLFVDGSHTYENVLQDIHAWTPNLASGGIVLFHDYNHTKAPGVTQAVQELIIPFQEYTAIGTARYLVAFQKD